MQEDSARPYHHGDLKRVVIETAQAMLREDKGWQFTLREVARRAGVSHAAPYKHFPDKSALLAELATLGFHQLRDADRRCASSPAALGARGIHRGGQGLHPLRHRQSFPLPADVQRRRGQDGLCRIWMRRALPRSRSLLGILERGQKSGAFKPQPVRGQAAAAWALVHGFTMLAIDGQLLPEKVGAKPIDAVLISMLEGLES